MSLVRAAVVGAGQIAKQHLAALRSLPGIELVGVCDLSPVMAESTAARFGVEGWYTDFRTLLQEKRPDVVHIATPPATHFPVASECLKAGCHVLVEKPITLDYEQFQTLRRIAEEEMRWLVENHNYQFNRSVQEILALREAGGLGEVRHVDVQIRLQVFAAGGRFAARDVLHPALREPAGVVSDFLTHLCYLAYLFIGPHRDVRCIWNRFSPRTVAGPDNFQALVAGKRGTALLGFSADCQPDAFTLRVQGTRSSAETNLFECGIVASSATDRLKALAPVRNSLRRARAERRNAVHSLLRKLSGGPGPYEGLWELVRLLYERLQSGGPPPVPIVQVDDVNRMTGDILNEVFVTCES